MANHNKTEAEAFVAAILDRPEDELNYLVYSDWLEESGAEHHAVLVRLLSGHTWGRLSRGARWVNLRDRNGESVAAVTPQTSDPEGSWRWWASGKGGGTAGSYRAAQRMALSHVLFHRFGECACKEKR